MIEKENCGRYLLRHLYTRHSRNWLSSPRRPNRRHGTEGKLVRELTLMGLDLTEKQRERFAGFDSVMEVFTSNYVRGVALDSHEGLVGWFEDRYPLIIRHEIPGAQEMLSVQCEGNRIVTLLLNEEEQNVRYGRHADACDFMLHDFEHAHKFFGEPRSHSGQVRFFRRLKASLARFEIWSGDTLFKRDLEYLMSDMNSHPMHLLKYLKAIVLNAEMRRTGLRKPDLEAFWRGLFVEWGFVDESLDSVLKINQPEVETEDDIRRANALFMPAEI